MSAAPLLPGAEHVLDVGVRRALLLIRRGHPHEDVERVLLVAGAAAVLIDGERERLDS